VEQIGSPETIYNEPASTFVAGFIGAPTMNLVPARIESKDEAVTIVLGREMSFEVPGEMAAPLRSWLGRDVTFGLRPEQLAWAADGSRGSFEVVASVVEPLGADTLAFFEIAGSEMVARVPPDAVRNSGDRLRLRPDLRRMHLFDPATGKRI
jgi:multiple sugar transport system ATP-binding protein